MVVQTSSQDSSTVMDRHDNDHRNQNKSLSQDSADSDPAAQRLLQTPDEDGASTAMPMHHQNSVSPTSHHPHPRPLNGTGGDTSNNDNISKHHPSQSHDKEEEDAENDDTVFLCRCGNPKLLVDMLQSFSKTGLSSSSRPSNTQGGGTQTQLRRNTATTNNTPQQPMTIFCSPTSVTIHSQSSNKQFQASMELPSTFFQHYQLHTGEENQQQQQQQQQDTFDFTIHWHTFLQCLAVLLTTSGTASSTNNSTSFFGPSHGGAANNSSSSSSSSSLTMSYHMSTELLRLEWETLLHSTYHNNTNNGNLPSSVMATAAIPGMETPEAEEAAELSAAFQATPIQARWLSASLCLKEAKTELELVPGAEFVQVEFWYQPPPTEEFTTTRKQPSRLSATRPQPCLRLLTKGHSSQVAVEIPGSIEFSEQKEEERRTYSPSQATSRSNGKPLKYAHTYTLAHWRQALQPLDMSKETCISVNQEGILAIQHSLNVQQQHHQSRRGHRNTVAVDDDEEEAPSAFCDFLLLPMLEQLEEDEEEPQEGAMNVNDDDSDSYMESSGLKTQSSHNQNRDMDDEDESTAATLSQHSHRSRPRQKAEGRHPTGSHPEDRGASLPIGSDEETEEEDNDAPQPPPPGQSSGMLFPSLSGAIHNTPHSTMTQETMESSVLRHQRRRDQRKRQRRASNERQQQQQQQQHRRRRVAREDNDDRDSDRSVNLLEDSQQQQQNQQRRSHFFSSDDEKEDDEERYCSSPEIVYGES